jgi:hypothetical protein
VKEIAPYFLPEEALLYILQDMSAEQKVADRLMSDNRWRRFLFSRMDLERELLRLDQLGRVSFNIAGSVVSLELPYRSVGEYVEHLVGQ